MRAKIAKVLAHHDGMHPDAVSNDEDELPIWTTYLDVADAILDVLMHPSGNMLEAGWIAASDYEDRNPHEGFSIPDNDPISMFVFRAMIEAAKEGK